MASIGDLKLDQAMDIGKLTLSPENIIACFIALIAGYIIVRILSGRLEATIAKNTKMPKIMTNQLIKAIKLFLYLIVILIALGFIGVQSATIIISVMAFVSIILGFGLQDTVNNIASGVWIASSKAYDIDDEVVIAGESGVVKDMNVMSTEIKRLDNTRVLIPNGKIWNGSIVNVTRMPTRLIAVEYGVAYDTDIKDAMEAALTVCERHPKLHREPEPIVRFKEMADSAVILQLRVWIDTNDYYPVKSDLLNMLYDELNARNITIPFPQRDVHLYSKE
ncbi:mechanosensitive ion channel family protein [Methanoplanus endosymbiosus]|uniref:Mechanosensitive ion channel family protein n=1 Tax=Methanoplanus endosymbiosus TaxID=33865 RepID=A0A9E7PRF2_9EURY|nr:mechanosensitive ion channel family protein [Methanoplanus endosymbiosus]UUX93621.1 mechanosensitive ion channel family protein [Methanoplanus endosymbiosus]